MTDPQVLIRQSLEAAGVNVGALVSAISGAQGSFSVPQNLKDSRQLMMSTGALLKIERDGLEGAIERDPVKAPAAMRRVQAALLVLAKALAMFDRQGTVPAAEESGEIPDDENGLDEGQRAS